jgi:hypothetical protein
LGVSIPRVRQIVAQAKRAVERDGSPIAIRRRGPRDQRHRPPISRWRWCHLRSLTGWLPIPLPE